MQFKLKKTFCFLSIVFGILNTTCDKPPYEPNYSNVKGYAIGKETCNTDESQDYWLIDLTYLPDTPQYGDTLFFNGTNYTNVVKTKGLPDQLKQIGKRISINFRTITSDKIQSTNCTVAEPITYNLKEIIVIDAGEIR